MELLLKIWPHLLNLWQLTLPTMFIGLFIGNYLKQSNLSDKIEKLTDPFTRFAHLPVKCSLPIAFCFLDRVIGFTMLQSLYKQNEISKQEVLISVIISKAVMSSYPLIFLLLPLLISTVGLKYGLKFFSFYASLFLLTSLSGILWGRLIFPQPVQEQHYQPTNSHSSIPQKPDSRVQKIKIALAKSNPLFIQMASIFIFFSFLALWLVELGIIEFIINKLEPLLFFLKLSSSSVTFLALSTGTLSMLAAIASLGSAFQTGLINFHQLAITLLVASFLHNIYEVWSYDLPINVSIFGNRLGSHLTLLSFLVHESFIFLGIIIIAF